MMINDLMATCSKIMLVQIVVNVEKSKDKNDTKTIYNRNIANATGN